MKRLSAPLLVVLALGCAPSFDPPSEIKTLRVLAVQKDQPYAPPGAEVTLNMLWHDALAEPGRTVQRAWLGGCENPPGDLYQGCFSQLAEKFSADPTSELFELDGDDEFSVTLSPDIVRDRPTGQYDYGLAYVFFAVCAGTITPAFGQEGLPFNCLDSSGDPLGADHFVVGYTAIYSFAEFGNTNPIITPFFRFQGVELAADCVGNACIGLPITDPDTIDCTEEGAPCVPACPDDGEPECPEYEIMPLVSEDSVERDEVSAATYDADFQEQLWLNYYVDRGSIAPDAKLVNDATEGWNPEQQGEFRAPAEPGMAAVWAVVHDNRGGVDFARFTIKVE